MEEQEPHLPPIPEATDVPGRPQVSVSGSAGSHPAPKDTNNHAKKEKAKKPKKKLPKKSPNKSPGMTVHQSKTEASQWKLVTNLFQQQRTQGQSDCWVLSNNVQ
ncbi:hypothetical protein PCASD_00015 [Puccinia coronata f. sp. avenae]|uniref:Uncharacterized protein n=1 Tax=Puccinia coronata f. sp. avenae TaxID=200324 RepID=A0A2N5VQI3_9BASI|nr:hypothetical protein PCASD_00015 [Puccinia coronata f. sp. avenae]